MKMCIYIYISVFDFIFVSSSFIRVIFLTAVTISYSVTPIIFVSLLLLSPIRIILALSLFLSLSLTLSLLLSLIIILSFQASLAADNVHCVCILA